MSISKTSVVKGRLTCCGVTLTVTEEVWKAWLQPRPPLRGSSIYEDSSPEQIAQGPTVTRRTRLIGFYAPALTG
jgi:hypothetical protein